MIARLLLIALLAAAPLAAQTNPLEAKKSYIHTLQLADRVRVAIYLEDDLTTLARIDARGMVNLPLVGEVKVGGLTLMAAQDAIQAAYRDGRYLRAPQVTLTVEEYAPREVSISGQINSPGRYPLPVESTYTVVELVTKAGGIKDVGKGTAVTVTRILPDGSRKVFTVDVESTIRGKKTDKNQDTSLLLEPGDLVFIPERLI